MSHHIKHKSKTAGLPPGTLVHSGEKKSSNIRISVIDYNSKKFEEKKVKTVEECFPFKKKSSVTWINIDGLHQPDIINSIGKQFGIHPLVLEDILNTGQRPKAETFDDYIFVVLKMVLFDPEVNDLGDEQFSLLVGPSFVISFQEKEGDVFDSIRERIRTDKGRVRSMGADYLAYSLIDSIVDNYFRILEKLGTRIEELEEKLIADPKPKVLHDIYGLKREMLHLRKSIWPLREVVNELERAGKGIIKRSTFVYLRDVYDHTVQVIDTIETFRDILSGMIDIYLSSVSYKLNEVMKILTIIATIFIPLTFITGVYGMNFKNMPELFWQWGYAASLSLMAIIGIGMFLFFKKKRWV